MYYRYGLVGGSGMMSGGWLMFLVSAVFWFLFVLAIALLVVWVVRMMRHDRGDTMVGPRQGGMPGEQPSPPAHDEAVAIARKRFAAGKITKEQFDELMKTLG